MQSLENGTQLGAYTIVRLIGRGGMGEVYEAYEKRLQRRVAIKVISPQKVGEHGEVDLVRRFLQEARTLAQVNHPNVVTIYAIDRIQETQFIAMEFVDGALLKDILSVFALSADEATPMFLQMLEGLRSLHDAKILHRDLKPHNLMLRPNGQIKILDFGIAKREGDREREQTTVGVVIGTLAYLPPEVLYGTPANVRSDLWSLGAIFYECLVGQPLVSLHQMKVKGVRAANHSDVIFPQDSLGWIPEEMRRIVGQLCDKIPENRYASTAQAIEDLKRFQQSRPPVPAGVFSSLAKNVENIGDFKDKIDTKSLTGPKAKRALALALITGAAPAASDISRVEVELQKPSTQEIADSISARRRARRRARKKNMQVPWTAALAILVTLVGLSAAWFKVGKSESLKKAELPTPQAVQAIQATAMNMVAPFDRQTLWLEPNQIPTFTWSRVVAAGEYELQIGSDGEVNSVVVSEKVNGNSYRPSRILPEGRYQWRLLPLHGQTEPLGVNHFVVSYLSPPDLVSPSAGWIMEMPAKDKREDVSLSWKCKAGAQRYRAQLSRELTFNSVVREQLVSTCNLDQTPLLPGTYYWRVRVEEPTVARARWSEKRSFTLKSLSARPARLATVKTSSFEKLEPRLEHMRQVMTLKFAGSSSMRTPASAYRQLSNPPMLSWAPVHGAKLYEVQIASSADFSNMLIEEKVTGTGTKWRQVVPGRSFWRVRAIAESGDRSAFSPAGRLDIHLPAPKFKSGEKNILGWSPVPLADKYVVQISPDRSMASVIEKVTAQTQTPVEVRSTPIYMRVAALNSSGESVSDYSAIATVSPPPAAGPGIGVPELLTPPVGAHVHVGGSGRISVVFSWSKVDGALDYELQIASDLAFKQIIDQEKSLPSRGYVLKEAELKGFIYWRARARTPTGFSDWNATGVFEVR